MNFSHSISRCVVVVIGRPSSCALRWVAACASIFVGEYANASHRTHVANGFCLINVVYHFVHVVCEVIAAGYGDCPRRFCAILFAQLVEVSATLFKHQFRALARFALPACFGFLDGKCLACRSGETLRQAGQTDRGVVQISRQVIHVARHRCIKRFPRCVVLLQWRIVDLFHLLAL